MPTPGDDDTSDTKMSLEQAREIIQNLSVEDVDAAARTLVDGMTREELDAIASRIPTSIIVESLRRNAPHLVGYHNDPGVKETHRLIGGYVTTFSELTATLREHTLDLLRPSLEATALLETLFETFTADPLQRALFAVATSVATHDDTDVAIRNVLRRRVQAEIQFRNDLVHADWNIGWRDATTDDPVPPTATKIKMTGGVAEMRELDIDDAVLRAHINELQDLRWELNAYVVGCLNQGHLASGPGIQELLVLHRGKRGDPNEVRRTSYDPEKVRIVRETRRGTHRHSERTPASEE